MKSLLLTVTLFGLLALLQAQDDLPFLSEDRNVSQGGREGIVVGMFVLCLWTEACTHELLIPLSLSANTAPLSGALSAFCCSPGSIAVLPAGMALLDYRI